MELLCEKAKSSSNASDTIKSVADAKRVYDKTIADPVEQEKIRLLEKTQLDNFISIAKAKEEGIKEGIEKGKQEGAQEKMRELAVNMKKQGLEDEFIAKCLSISVDDLKLLLNSKEDM